MLGLAFQHLAKRPKVTQKETRKERQQRADRESRWWKTASKQIPAPAPGRLQVEVANRAPTCWSSWILWSPRGSTTWCVRSTTAAFPWETGRKRSCTTLPAKFRKEDAVLWKWRRRPNVRRTATVAVSWAKVTVLIPKQPRGEIRGVPLTTWVVRMAEIDPPADVEPLEWILLTNVPVNDLADANERIDWYRCRWIVEEYHKALKTGCQIEDMQFTREDRLQPAIALISVVAVSLLQLRDASRRPDAETRLATALFPVLLVMVLSRGATGNNEPISPCMISATRWPDWAAIRTAKATTAPVGLYFGAVGRNYKPWQNMRRHWPKKDVGKLKGCDPWA